MSTTNWQATAPTTMFAADDGPDLSWWWCSPSFQYKEMIAGDICVRFDDLYKSEGWDKAYPAGTLAYFSEPDGHRYGINIDVVWTPYVYYNKEIFKKVGVEPPKTWDDLYALAGKVRAAGYQPMVTLYDYGMVNHLPDGLMMRSWTRDEYLAFMINWSPKAPPETLKYKWTDPHGVRIFQTLKDIADKGFAADGFAGMTDADVARSLFTSGKAAMLQNGSWDGAATGLPAAAKFELGYFYYPPMDNPAYGPVGSWVFPNCYIAFNRHNQEAAKKVIAFLASQEGVTNYVKASALTPGRPDLPAGELAKALSPMTVQMVQDVKDQGAPALFEIAGAAGHSAGVEAGFRPGAHRPGHARAGGEDDGRRLRKSEERLSPPRRRAGPPRRDRRLPAPAGERR